MKTMSLSLVIANKNYSSWSMRPWVLLTAFDIAFTEIMVKFHSADWSRELPRLSPPLMVPVLWDGEVGDDKSICVWDSAAIIETIAESYPEHAVWPRDKAARANARSGARQRTRDCSRNARRISRTALVNADEHSRPPCGTWHECGDAKKYYAH